MAHFAKLDENNIVIDVNVIDNQEVELNGGNWSTQAEQHVSDTYGGGTWKQTSYNTFAGEYYDNATGALGDQSKAFRKNYAGIGYIYHEDINAFSPPKPYESWTLNSTTARWQPPVAFPTITTTGTTLTGPLGVSWEQKYEYRWDEENSRWLADVKDEYEQLVSSHVWNATSLQWEIA
jgi:hypothetical protein|tara:strand:- start:845 stop:1378 length:534 start_codon:yes stop_codon:yes gene_type:complete